MRTRVGYAGGAKRNPTYHDLGDHAEAIEIDFDPTQISFEQIMERFWKAHDPRRPAFSRQYMAAVFPRGEEQDRIVRAGSRRVEKELRGAVATEIIPNAEFYLAEDYHQKYYLRQIPEVVRDFDRMYPNPRDFVDSTAAARVNAYVGHNRAASQFADEQDTLALSPDALDRLRQILR